MQKIKCRVCDKKFEVLFNYNEHECGEDASGELLNTELKEDILSLLYSISSSQVGYFGIWTGYCSQLDKKRVDYLIERLSV